MKKEFINKIIGLLLMVLCFASCKKDKTVVVKTSAINVINAAVDAGSVKVNPGGGNRFNYVRSTDQVSYGTGKLYSVNSGDRIVNVVTAADTTKLLFSRSVNFQQKMYSLYIAGKSPNIDTMFREESNIPFTPSFVSNPDNIVYIRFVNLSSNSVPVNINIRSPATTEVTSLAYKGISDFKKYEAKSSTANYVFEVRNAATNVLLTTYTFNPTTNRFKTVAIVIKGLMGTTSGTNAFNTSLITYF